MIPYTAMQDTIVAIATAPGAGAIGVIRVSGPKAFALADAVTKAAKPARTQKGHTLRRVIVHDPVTGEAIDDGLLAVFHAPKSFTGEDVIEFQGHGGAVVLKRTFTAFLRANLSAVLNKVRAARPGEFSERAFVNGKLDLAQAEAIADLIAAGTVAAQRAARRQLGGDLSFAVRRAAAAVQEALMFIEASIDFPDEVGELNAAGVEAALKMASEILENLLSTAAYGKRLRDGMTLVLTGRPNVGKSSLLNALSGTERAIVTPIPGTTRDVVEESLNIAGIPVRALDTAGLRDTDDPIERIGVERARQAADDADVIVAVLDATAGFTDPDRALLQSLAGRPALVAVNKSDAADPTALLTQLADFRADFVAVPVSAVTKAGLPELAAAIAALVTGGTASANAPLVTSARHEAALHDANAALTRARDTLTAALPAELIAVDAHAALYSLGEITGETTREDILASIFARFCIGK